MPGNPPIVPAWAFNPWVWEDSLNTRDGALKLIRLYKENDIPVGAIIIDSPWSTAYNNFEWDTDRYPEPQEMIDEMHKNGVSVVMWLTGFINSESTDVPVKKSRDYEYVKSKNYVVDDGLESDWWKGKGVHIDFTNPDAVSWFHGQLDKILDMNIDGWTGEKYETGSLLRSKEYSLDKYPVFIRAGAVIPMYVTNDVTGHGGEESVGKQTIVIYPEGITEYTFHRPRGQGVEYNDVKIRVDDQERSIRVESDIDDSYIFLIHTNEKNFKKIDKSGKHFIVKY